MNEDEARAALKARGYSIHLRQRRERVFIYAARRINGKLTERYLAPLTASDLPALIEALPNMSGHNSEPQKLGNPPTRAGRNVGQQSGPGESEKPERRQELASDPQQAHDPEHCNCLECRSSRGYRHISQQEQYNCELAALARLASDFAQIWYKAAIDGRLTGYTPLEKIIWPGAGAIYTHLAGGDVLRGLELAQEIRVQIPLHGSKWSPTPLESLLWTVRPGDTPTTHPALARFLELLRPCLPPDLQNFPKLPNTSGIFQSKQGSSKLRARLKAIGKRLAYREVWFSLEDVYNPGASRLPPGQEHWNDWADHIADDWQLEVVIAALERKYPEQPPTSERIEP